MSKNEAIKDANQTTVSEADAKKAHEKAIRDKNNKEMKNARKRVSQFMET